jgi:predicted transcriptional regulator
VLNFLTIIKIVTKEHTYYRFIQVFEKLLNYFVKKTFIEIFRNFWKNCQNKSIFSKKKIDKWTPSSCMALKRGPNMGYWAQNAVKVVKFIKIVCFQWS